MTMDGLRRISAADLDLIDGDAELEASIRDEIAATGPMTFARFMELALYDPERGYYRGAAARPGRDGDFLTAPEAHPIFGQAVARLAIDLWSALGRPSTFTIREHGAGSGALAAALVEGVRAAEPDLGDALRYRAVEVEPRRLEELRARSTGSCSPTRSSMRCRPIASSEPAGVWPRSTWRSPTTASSMPPGRRRRRRSRPA
jgi:SAM-dependent MidA family methyltransferase